MGTGAARTRRPWEAGSDIDPSAPKEEVEVPDWTSPRGGWWSWTGSRATTVGSGGSMKPRERVYMGAGAPGAGVTPGDRSSLLRYMRGHGLLLRRLSGSCLGGRLSRACSREVTRFLLPRPGELFISEADARWAARTLRRRSGRSCRLPTARDSRADSRTGHLTAITGIAAVAPRPKRYSQRPPRPR
jgi:hypothetical protein